MAVQDVGRLMRPYGGGRVLRVGRDAHIAPRITHARGQRLAEGVGPCGGGRNVGAKRRAPDRVFDDPTQTSRTTGRDRTRTEKVNHKQ